MRFGKHDIEVTVSFRALHERSTGTRPSALIVENTVDGIGEVIERTDITLLRYAIGVLRGFMAVIPCRLLGLGENLVPLVIGQRCRLMLQLSLYRILSIVIVLRFVRPFGSRIVLGMLPFRRRLAGRRRLRGLRSPLRMRLHPVHTAGHHRNDQNRKHAGHRPAANAKHLPRIHRHGRLRIQRT